MSRSARPPDGRRVHVLDGTGPIQNFNYAAFPGEGYYPRQFVDKHYAWSLHLANLKVKVPPAADLKVTVTRLDEHYQPGGRECRQRPDRSNGHESKRN